MWRIAALSILVTGASVTVSLLVLIVGVFVWIGFAYLLRWTTGVDRQRAGWQRHEPIRAVYPRPPARGLMPPTLLGDWNWYLPHWLEWLPRVSREEAVTPPPTEARPRVPAGA